MDEARYVVVGGGLAGGSAAKAIRERDPHGRLVLVANEPHLPYDRVPLSKQYLMGQLPRERLFLERAQFYEQQHVELRTRRRAVQLKLAQRRIVLDDGAELGFEQLLLATGGRVRRLPIPGSELPGIYYLRTLEDAEALQAALAHHRRAVVVGGGFIGSEVAAACRTKGLETTVLEMEPWLLNRAVDAATARWITEYFAQQGVQLRTNVRVARFLAEQGRAAGVETADGERIAGDFVAVGIGIAPNLELARDAGLPVDNGIVVNQRLEVNATGVFAAGDVARFYSPVYEKHLRVEHYDVAVKQGRIAGANMAGGSETFGELPYFFSFMFKLRVQVWGDLTEYDRVLRRGPLQLTNKGGFAQFYLRANRIQGYLAVNRSPREASAAQRLILTRTVIEDPDRLADETTDLAAMVAEPD